MKEIEKAGKRVKVKKAVDNLTTLLNNIDNRTVTPEHYNTANESMRKVISSDIMCCSDTMLNEIIIPINKSLDYSLPDKLVGVCSFFGEKIRMYIATRERQRNSGKRSGEMMKGKKPISHTDLVAETVIEDMDKLFGGDNVNIYMDMDMNLLSELKLLTAKIYEKAVKWERART